MASVTGELAVEIEEKRFSLPDGSSQTVLRDVAFRLMPGEFVAVVGPSGCGKTTLLNIVAGLDEYLTGTVQIGGQLPSTVQIGYVFQHPRLLPWCTVFENVALVLPRGADPSTVERLLDAVGLRDTRNVYPSRLSVGMARRVAIARAFAVEPELLLMDEPFVSLDAATAERLRSLLLDLWRSRPTGVLFVTHDLREAIELADRIMLLSDSPGRLLADIAVPLPRGGRSDRAAVEAVRSHIADRQRSLLGDAASKADASRACVARS
jgi:ABC-type nitrate/sulfonate/bicarbonate transport system ATPase subunit